MHHHREEGRSVDLELHVQSWHNKKNSLWRWIWIQLIVALSQPNSFTSISSLFCVLFGTPSLHLFSFFSSLLLYFLARHPYISFRFFLPCFCTFWEGNILSYIVNKHYFNQLQPHLNQYWQCSKCTSMQAHTGSVDPISCAYNISFNTPCIYAPDLHSSFLKLWVHILCNCRVKAWTTLDMRHGKLSRHEHKTLLGNKKR